MFNEYTLNCITLLVIFLIIILFSELFGEYIFGSKDGADFWTSIFKMILITFCIAFVVLHIIIYLFDILISRGIL